MASDWWQRKAQEITGHTAGPQRHGITVQPRQPAVQQPSVPQPVYPQQHTQQAPQQPQPQPQPGRQQVLDPNRPADAEITMGEAMRLWQGGEAARKEGDLACPECGSTTGYTHYSGAAAGSVKVGGQNPRSHCFECGYNGHFSQGLESNWA